VAGITGNVCTEADLLAVAGQRSFDRGTAYVDAVGDLTIFGNQITASVRGTDEYIVLLTLGGSERVTGTCDCPYGNEGFFCKHCVAVGLAFLRNARASRRHARQAKVAEHGDAGERSEAADSAKPAGLHSWLNSLPREQLILLILDQLVEDEDWRRRLQMRAASAAADFTAIAARLDALLDPAEFGEYGYVEEDESRRYARRVDTATAIVGELISSGHRSEAITVAEYAITIVAAACHHAVDPAGVIWAAAEHLAAVHLEACQADPTDRAGLAGFLAMRMLSKDDIPLVDVASYRAPLGHEGLATLREVLTTAVQQAPDSSRARSALADVLRAAGDVDALVDLLAADLPRTGLGHLAIAKDLLAAGREDEAISWAERGLAMGGPCEPITAFLTERHVAAGRMNDALSARRDLFAAVREMQPYERLRETAELVGDWPATREWAHGLLRSDAEAHRSRRPGIRLWAGPVLIDVLLSEGEVEAAWEEAAGAASETQWLKLADLIATARPADALAVYLRQIRALKQETGDKAYERIARLLANARACHRRLGTEASFDIYLRALRYDQKRKTKLIRILDAHQLTPA
jgi:uncharacterized Zn finger protein